MVAKLPSTSLTLIPVILSSVSSATDCAVGTVLTGASFTATTFTVLTAGSLSPVPSFAVMVNVRAVPELGFSESF